jgi:hypothetical protein
MAVTIIECFHNKIQVDCRRKVQRTLCWSLEELHTPFLCPMTCLSRRLARRFLAEVGRKYSPGEYCLALADIEVRIISGEGYQVQVGMYAGSRGDY